MDRQKLKEIYDKNIFGYLRKNPMARFDDIPTHIFIDAMEEAINYSHSCKSDSEQLCGCDVPLIRTNDKGGEYCGLCEKDLE